MKGLDDPTKAKPPKPVPHFSRSDWVRASLVAAALVSILPLMLLLLFSVRDAQAVAVMIYGGMLLVAAMMVWQCLLYARWADRFGYRCTQCGYALDMESTTCSECGTPNAAEAPYRPFGVRMPRWLPLSWRLAVVGYTLMAPIFIILPMLRQPGHWLKYVAIGFAAIAFVGPLIQFRKAKHFLLTGETWWHQRRAAKQNQRG